MANAYTRADLVAAWQFETSPGIWKDTKAIQPDLTPTGPPTADTTNQMEGAQCAAFAAGQYLSIPDANLVAGFPFKSGDTTKLMTVSCHIRPTTIDANNRRIWSKWNTTGNQRCLQLYLNSTKLFLNYSSNGSAATAIDLGFLPVVNQKYHITISVDGIALVYWCRIYDATAGTWYLKIGTMSGLVASTANWCIGNDDQALSTTNFIGQIDECLVFNSKIHNSEAVAVQSGNFPVTGVNIYDYLIDPPNGNDSNDGFSSAAKAFKTAKKPFYPGEINYFAKCPEAAQAGTATATLGSNSITTTNDLSAACPQYTLIRFDTDPMLYMVKAITSSVITLYRPYRGASASGKVVNKLTTHAIASGDIYPTTCLGLATNRITLMGGMNLSTFAQEGFSIFGTTGAALNQCFQGTWNWCNVSRMGAYNFNWPWDIVSGDSTFTLCFVFRTGLSCFHNGSLQRFIINGFVSELGAFPSGWFGHGIINDPDVVSINSPAFTLQTTIDVIINRLRTNADAQGNSRLIEFNTRAWGVRFVDAVLDEMASGVNQVLWGAATGGAICDDVVFQNPTIGAGTLVTMGGQPNIGEISFANINGSETDHRSYYPSGGSDALKVKVQPDYSVYNTATPSVQITLPGAGTWFPFFMRHYVPCLAGVSRTISAHLRKNSSYGSANLPFMRLRWITGTAPNLVNNLHDVPMADVNDAFQLVSHNVTPSIKGTIIVEFYVNSPNAGAVVWYDDVPEVVV